MDSSIHGGGIHLHHSVILTKHKTCWYEKNMLNSKTDMIFTKMVKVNALSLTFMADSSQVLCFASVHIIAANLKNNRWSTAAALKNYTLLLGCVGSLWIIEALMRLMGHIFTWTKSNWAPIEHCVLVHLITQSTTSLSRSDWSRSGRSSPRTPSNDSSGECADGGRSKYRHVGTNQKFFQISKWILIDIFS